MAIKDCSGNSCKEFQDIIEEVVQEYPGIFENSNVPLEIIFRKIWNASLRSSTDFFGNYEGTDHGAFQELMA